ncbi:MULTISPECIES: hypothetical protein [unclassified Tenacibaculum]|uniref:hypothetical protein n=1 Tax=unclassified Tenacibaculum TaxID=2635139 RepID=UPI001F3E74CB|nr:MULTISPECIES: hypothetical protein [unclassified Tenacibaculum]MCF2875916.1 hypothetical protein [Tenacibaculum sp. Cn5-1]MCF2935991.1 hypothetical protein [Tenacibaculum sp. Cn5-34]MCG7512552.1 hypothetical protein [Tenacibaculum sp. Cn5-46]
MIKKIVYSILLILSIIFTVGFFRYNPTVNLSNTIPSSAEAIVRINLREAEFNIVKDVVLHPLSYIDFEESSESDSEKRISLFDQIEIPNNVFFYTNSTVLKDFWVSSTIEVNDKAGLVNFLKKEGKLIEDKSRINCFAYKKLFFLLKENKLSVVYSLKKTTNIDQVLNAVFEKKSYLKENDTKLLKLKNSNGIIAFQSKEFGFFEFEKDEEELILKGELNEENSPFLAYDSQELKEGMASFSGRINKECLLSFIDAKKKEKFKKLTNLSLDSLNNYWNGEIDFSLESFQSENDTIVTYEYDDDFNKVEKKSIHKSLLPEVCLKIGGGNVFKYLYENKGIQNVEGEELLVLNPLFKTYANNEEEELQLYSIDDNVFDFTPNKENKFSMVFNVESYLEENRGLYTLSNKYLKQVQKIKATVSNDNQLELIISLKESSLKSIYQDLK